MAVTIGCPLAGHDTSGRRCIDADLRLAQRSRKRLGDECLHLGDILTARRDYSKANAVVGHENLETGDQSGTLELAQAIVDLVHVSHGSSLPMKEARMSATGGAAPDHVLARMFAARIDHPPARAFAALQAGA